MVVKEGVPKLPKGLRLVEIRPPHHHSPSLVSRLDDEVITKAEKAESGEFRTGDVGVPGPPTEVKAVKLTTALFRKQVKGTEPAGARRP